MSVRGGWRCLFALSALVVLGACSGGLGDVCSRDDDCRAGLRCSARGSTRGVCLYDDVLHDGAPAADLHRPDQSIDGVVPLPDGSRDLPRDAREDGRGDGSGDRGTSDGAWPDTVADGVSSDGARD